MENNNNTEDIKSVYSYSKYNIKIFDIILEVELINLKSNYFTF